MTSIADLLGQFGQTERLLLPGSSAKPRPLVVANVAPTNEQAQALIKVAAAEFQIYLSQAPRQKRTQ